MTNAAATMIDFVACWISFNFARLGRVFYAPLGIYRERGAIGRRYELCAIRNANGSRYALLWCIPHPTDARRYIWHRADWSGKVVHGCNGDAIRALCKGHWMTKQRLDEVARSM